MNISELHSLFLLLADKEQGAYFPPGDIDRFLDRGSMWLFNDFRAVYAENVEAFEALAPFKTAIDYSTNSSGEYTVPSLNNYVQLLSLDVAVVDSFGTRRWPVKVMKEDELAARLASQLKAPSSTKPVAVETGVGAFKIWPAATHGGTIRFLKRPAAPVYGFTQSGRRFTYNSGTSTQLEWTEPYQNKVVLRALHLAGINLNDQQLQQAGILLPQNNV